MDEQKTILIVEDEPLARQIISTARVEMEFIRTIAAAESEGQRLELGNLSLGTEKSAARSARAHATAT